MKTRVTQNIHIRLLQILLFLLCSTLEVKVHAGEYINLRSQSDPLEWPEGCLSSVNECSFKTQRGEKFEVQVGDSVAVLSENTIVTRVRADSIQLLKGMVWISSEKELSLGNLYAQVKANEAEILASIFQERLTIRVLKGQVLVKPKGHPSEILLKPGYEIWISRVNTMGIADVGIPEVFDVFHTIHDLAALNTYSKSDFHEYAQGLVASWRDALEESTLLYKKTVQRNLAKVATKEQQRDAALKKEKKEREELRSLMWKRNFE